KQCDLTSEAQSLRLNNAWPIQHRSTVCRGPRALRGSSVQWQCSAGAPAPMNRRALFNLLATAPAALAVPRRPAILPTAHRIPQESLRELPVVAVFQRIEFPSAEALRRRLESWR